MLVSEAVLSLIRSFREPIAKAIDVGIDEIDELFSIRLTSYLQLIKTKFEKTKTFLHRDSVVDFEKTYFPVVLQKTIVEQDGVVLQKKQDGALEFKSRTENYRFTHVESLYRNRNYTTIFGNAGSGKSMLMKKIFLTCIEQKIKIPIFLELKALNVYDGSLSDYIKNEIIALGINRSVSLVEKTLKSGSFIFLFDGYDEIYSEHKFRITDDIERFIDHYSKNWFVITSRKSAGLEALSRFDNNYILPLELKDIESFVKKQCAIIGDTLLAEKIIQEIHHKDNATFLTYLNNPLLLSMFLLFYRSNIRLPDNKYDFYNNVYSTILTKHYAWTRTGGWQHERLSKLSDRSITNVLCWFSYRTYFLGLIEFTFEDLENQMHKIIQILGLKCDTGPLIHDLLVNINIIIQEGTVYRFPHRSLQEYFTVRQIDKLDKKNKEKVYQKQLETHFSKSTDSCANLLDLIAEKDPVGLYESYLLPSIEAKYGRFKDMSLKTSLTTVINNDISGVGFKVDFPNRNINIVNITLKHYKTWVAYEYLTGEEFVHLAVKQFERLFLERDNNIFLVKNYFLQRRNSESEMSWEYVQLVDEDLIELIILLEGNGFLLNGTHVIKEKLFGLINRCHGFLEDKGRTELNLLDLD